MRKSRLIVAILLGVSLGEVSATDPLKRWEEYSHRYEEELSLKAQKNKQRKEERKRQNFEDEQHSKNTSALFFVSLAALWAMTWW